MSPPLILVFVFVLCKNSLWRIVVENVRVAVSRGSPPKGLSPRRFLMSVHQCPRTAIGKHNSLGFAQMASPGRLGTTPSHGPKSKTIPHARLPKPSRHAPAAPLSTLRPTRRPRTSSPDTLRPKCFPRPSPYTQHDHPAHAHTHPRTPGANPEHTGH